MKKCSLLIAIICTWCSVNPVEAGTFDGLRTFVNNLPFLRKPVEPAKETFQTPSGMVPLADYSYIGKEYAPGEQVNDLAQQLASGVRYFVFDLTETTQSRYFGISKQTTITIGDTQRTLSSVLDELNILLHQSQYKDEIILINLNPPQNQGLLNTVLKKNKHLFTPSDVVDKRLRPLLIDLRRLDKRIVVLLEHVTNNSPQAWASVSFFTEKGIGRPIKKILVFGSHELSTVNTLNHAAVGSDNFPKTTRGQLLSPHFNMYHYVGTYVGIDYTNTETNLGRELAYGVRGFILPIRKDEKSGQPVLVAKHRVILDSILPTIVSFAQTYNEIIVIHLRNTSESKDMIEHMLKKYDKILFKPSDRLAEVKNNTHSADILKKETGDIKIIWPRLAWNYQHKKLLHITYDGDADTENMWAFKHYYNDDYSLKNDNDTFLCYSGITKTQERLALAATATTTIALAAVLIYWTYASMAAFPLAHIARHYPQCTAGIGDACAGIGIIAGPGILLGTLVRLGLGIVGLTGLANLGVFISDKIGHSFTMIEEIKVADNTQLLRTAQTKFLTVQQHIEAKISSPNTATTFDTVNQRNQVDNFATIAKFNMTWYLRLAHAIYKALQDNPNEGQSTATREEIIRAQLTQQ